MLRHLGREAKAEDWSHVEYLAKVMAEQAAATINRRLSGSAALTPASPTAARWSDFDFEFQPSIDRKLVDDLASLRFIGRTARSSFWASPAAARPTWPWRWPSRRSRPATGATSRPPTTWCAPWSRPQGGELRHQAACLHRTDVLVIDDVGLLPIDAEGAGGSSTWSTPATKTATPRW